MAWRTYHILANFQISERGTNREKNLKRGTFRNFLYITIQRLLQKQEHMIKIILFFASKRGTVPPKEEQLASLLSRLGFLRLFASSCFYSFSKQLLRILITNQLEYITMYVTNTWIINLELCYSLMTMYVNKHFNQPYNKFACPLCIFASI